MNSIINEESYRENIFIKDKNEKEFILIFSKNENPNHGIIENINKILEDNNVNAKINSQRFQKIIPYKILK